MMIKRCIFITCSLLLLIALTNGQVYSDSTGNAQDYGNQERTFSDEGTDGSNIGLHDGTQPDPGNSNSNPTSTNNDGSNNGENSIDTTNLGGNSNGNANQNITNLASNINSNANQYNAGTSEGCRFNVRLEVVVSLGIVEVLSMGVLSRS